MTRTSLRRDETRRGLRRILRATCATLVAAGAMGLAGASAQEPVRGKPSLELRAAGQNSYVFRLSDETPGGAVRARASAIAADAGGALGFVYTNTIKGFSATVPAGAMGPLLERHPEIVAVEPDTIYQIVAKPPWAGGPGGSDEEAAGGGADEVPWGIARTTGIHVSGGTTVDGSGQSIGAGLGTGRRVCVIDTGVDSKHPDLNVDKGASANFVSRGKNTADDQNGHGSHVAGTIGAIANNGQGVVGVAGNATIISVRVLDASGSGYLSWVIAGIDYVASGAPNCAVANMSLGGGASSALDDAVRAAASAGVKFAIAAGNSARNANNYSPARVNHTNVCTVSAFGQPGDTFAYFSNYGNPPIDYGAPGVSVKSTYKGGGYETLSGTSMAAPHVAGLLALGGRITGDGTVSGDPDGNPDTVAHLSSSGSYSCGS